MNVVHARPRSISSSPPARIIIPLAIYAILASIVAPSLGGQSIIDRPSAVRHVNRLIDKSQDSTAESLLERMTLAQDRLEYDGTLVYLHGHHLATLRIARRMNSGIATESLLALSGPIRAMARNERGVACMLSDANSFFAPRTAGVNRVLRVRSWDFEHIRKHYQMILLGESRVAGRETDVVGILPTDHYRYGHRYSIDRVTGLPLKSDLIGAAVAPIEQVMFTNLEVRPVAPGRVPTNTPNTLNGATIKTSKKSDLGVSRAAAEEAKVDGLIRDPVAHEVKWTLSKMPPGFEISASTRPGISDMATEHLMVSDGIASVSVYIQTVTDEVLLGTTEIGAINAVGGRVEGQHVIVIGEVPEPTVQMLFDGLMQARTKSEAR